MVWPASDVHMGVTTDAMVVILARCEIDINGGLSSASKIECGKVTIPDGEALDDIQFIDDRHFIMTTSDKGMLLHLSSYFSILTGQLRKLHISRAWTTQPSSTLEVLKR